MNGKITLALSLLATLSNTANAGNCEKYKCIGTDSSGEDEIYDVVDAISASEAASKCLSGLPRGYTFDRAVPVNKHSCD